MVGLHQILADTFIIITLRTTTKMSILFQVLFFLGLGLTVTEINIKKKYRNKT